jgi:PhnB protein
MSGDIAISLMLAVPDAPTAAAWYREALGANELWSLGSVIGLEVEGAPFFLAEPEGNGWSSPSDVGTTTVRVEVFVDDPDSLVARAVAAGADGSRDAVRDQETLCDEPLVMLMAGRLAVLGDLTGEGKPTLTTRCS